jgi:hypothetical protein
MIDYSLIAFESVRLSGYRRELFLATVAPDGGGSGCGRNALPC